MNGEQGHDQIFGNGGNDSLKGGSGSDWMEAVYVFPLPEASAVDAMRLQVGERVIEGESLADFGNPLVLGGNYEVVHHTSLLEQLIDEGRLEKASGWWSFST